MSQLKKGALLSYINILLSNIIGLLLTPYIIHSLGDIQYGLYSLIGAMVAYIGILDFGLNNTIVRFISKYKAENNKKDEENFLAITMRLYGLISFIVLCLGVVLYQYFDVIFLESMTIEEIELAKTMFMFLIVNLAITLPGGAYTAICSAYEHFVFPRAAIIIRYIIRSLSVVVLLYLGGDAISIVLLDTIVNILFILVIYVYTQTKLNVKMVLHSFRFLHVREILSFSIWIFLYAIVHQFQWNAGQFIIGVNLDTISVGVFAVGIMLGGYYAAFGGVINSVLIPKANQVVVLNSSGMTLTSLMVKYSRMNAFVMSLVFCGFFLFGEEFIILWVGKSFILSYKVALIMMIGLSILIVQGFGNSILEAKKKNQFKSLLSISTMGFAVVAGYFFSKNYGILGVAVPLCIAMIINGLVMNLYFMKIFNFKPFVFFRESLLKVFFYHTLLIIIFFYLKSFYVIQSWATLIGFITCFLITYFLVTYLLIFNDSEKEILLDKLS